MQIVLSEQIRKELVGHVVRTGVSVQELLTRRPRRRGQPKNLAVKTVKGWQNGDIKEANTEMLAWVLDAFSKLPDA